MSLTVEGTDVHDVLIKLGRLRVPAREWISIEPVEEPRHDRDFRGEGARRFRLNCQSNGVGGSFSFVLPAPALLKEVAKLVKGQTDLFEKSEADMRRREKAEHDRVVKAMKEGLKKLQKQVVDQKRNIRRFQTKEPRPVFSNRKEP